MGTQMGDEYAVKAMLTTSAALFKCSSEHTPSTVMRWLRRADFVVEGDVVPVGVSGDSPAQQISMDLCERWLWVIYVTMIECGEMLTSLTFKQAQTYSGEIVFVTQTLKLLAAEAAEAAEQAAEQGAQAGQGKGEDAEAEAEAAEEAMNMFSDEGWVKDPFMAQGSAAMAVMQQQTLLVRLVRESCLASAQQKTT